MARTTASARSNPVSRSDDAVSATVAVARPHMKRAHRREILAGEGDADGYGGHVGQGAMSSCRLKRLEC